MKKNLPAIYLLTLIIYSFYRFIGQYLIGAVDSMGSYIAFLCDLVIIAIGTYSITRMNAYIRLLILFFTYSIFTLIINSTHITLIAHINGLRPYLVFFFALIFCNNILESKYWLFFHQRFTKVLIAVLALHTLTAIYEFSLHGACDAVGGGMADGGSGVLTFICFSSVFFLILNHAQKNNYRHINFFDVWYYYLLLIPAFINETKITFILFPLFIILQLRFTIDNFHNIILMGFSAIIVIMLYAQLYGTMASRQESSVQNPLVEYTQREFLEHYLFSNNTTGYNISRFTKLTIGFELLRQNTMNFIFGFGIGLFKGFDLLGLSSFTRNYEWIILGTNSELFVLFFQTGILGSLIFLFSLFYSFIRPIQQQRPQFLLYRRFKLFFLALLIMLLIYNTALSEGPFILVAAYYLVHLAKFDLYHEKLCSQIEDSDN